MNDSGKVGQDVNFMKLQLKVQKLLPPLSHFPKTSSGPDWADSGPRALFVTPLLYIDFFANLIYQNFYN